MPTAPDRLDLGLRLRAASLLAAVTVLAVTACGRADPPMAPTSPRTATTTPSPGGSGTATPEGSAGPGGATPGDTASAGGTVSPGSSGSPSASPAPVPCTSVTPVRIEKSTVEPRRTTEVVTVVSDGRNLTSGTREQTDFVAPSLVGPDTTTTITDETTLAVVADLIEKSSKNTVLLTRPDAPDTGADTNKRPFNGTGTYVLYNASGLLTADVIVTCAAGTGAQAGQEQRWRFTAEADNVVGTVNCAVEPPKGNAVARQVYGTFC
jgi:hypothetical protein